MSAGGLLLTEAARAADLDGALSRVLAPWRRPLAVHDTGEIICDLALGGDCLADIAKLRAEPVVYERIVSDPTVLRLIDTLANDAEIAVTAVTERSAQPPSDDGLIPLTCNEIQDLLNITTAPAHNRRHRLCWPPGDDDTSTDQDSATTNDEPAPGHEDHDLRLEY